MGHGPVLQRSLAPAMGGQADAVPVARLVATSSAIGNAAFARLVDTQRFAGTKRIGYPTLGQPVQRQGGPGPGPVTDDPLDAAAVTRALRFYRSQPWLYTPAVIEQIRTEAGLAPAGGIADDLAQAVARWQRDNGSNDPALAVDGMAGPRTMPRLFPSGLAAAGQGAAFGADAQANVFDRWDTLGNAQARGRALVDEINKRLVDVGVPPVRLRLFNGSPNEAGSFDPFGGSWHMQLNRRLLDLAGLDEAGAQDLADTVFHEARHTEQWFWMARYRAGLGRSAAAIVAEMDIPPDIARAARRNPIRSGTVEAVIASGWWESVFGSRSGHREATLNRVIRADFRLTTEQCRFQRFPTPANQARVDAAQAEFDAAHERYVDLPEENDAFATGPAGTAGVTGTPNPAPVPDADPCAELTRLGRALPGPGPAPAIQGGGSGADQTEADADQPEVTPPTITGPLHEALPEDNLPE